MRSREAFRWGACRITVKGFAQTGRRKIRLNWQARCGGGRLTIEREEITKNEKFDFGTVRHVAEKNCHSGPFFGIQMGGRFRNGEERESKAESSRFFNGKSVPQGEYESFDGTMYGGKNERVLGMLRARGGKPGGASAGDKRSG